MRKGFFAVLLTGLLAFVLSSCGISAPNERKLIELIPDEVIRYTLDGEEYIPEITQLEILRQQFSEKDCVTECKISLEDDNLSRQEYIQLNCTYWDTGGWGLESWEELQPPQYTPLVPLGEDRFLAYFENLGYSRDSFERYDAYDEDGHLLDGMDALFNGLLTDNTFTQQCTVYQMQEVYPNLTVSGMTPAYGTFIMTAEFPRSFYWYIEADTSWLSYDWTISGKWHCEFTRKVEHWFKYIDKQYSVDVDLQLGYGDYDGDGMSFPVQGQFTINGERIEDLHSWNYAHWTEDNSLYTTHLTYDGLYSVMFNNDDDFHCKLRFYPDYAEVAIVKSSWDGEYEIGTKYNFYRI